MVIFAFMSAPHIAFAAFAHMLTGIEKVRNIENRNNEKEDEEVKVQLAHSHNATMTKKKKKEQAICTQLFCRELFSTCEYNRITSQSLSYVHYCYLCRCNNNKNIKKTKKNSYKPIAHAKARTEIEEYIYLYETKRSHLH